MQDSNGWNENYCTILTTLYLSATGKQIRSYEAVDGKNPITAVTTMPAPHCSVVFGSADSVLRFIDPRKPGLQVAISLSKLIPLNPYPKSGIHQLSIIAVISKHFLHVSTIELF